MRSLLALASFGGRTASLVVFARMKNMQKWLFLDSRGKSYSLASYLHEATLHFRLASYNLFEGVAS